MNNSVSTNNTETRLKVEEFFKDFPTINLVKGEVLLNAFEDPKGIYFLASGNILQYGFNQKSAKAIVNSFKPGAFFPVTWAFNHSFNIFFFEASEKSTIHIAPVTDTLKFLRANSDVTFDLLTRLSSGLDGLVRKTFYSYAGNAKDKIICELLIISKRYGKALYGGRVLLKLTHDDLASRCGLTRETVTRTLGSLQKNNLISLGNNKIEILDSESLEKVLRTSLLNKHSGA